MAKAGGIRAGRAYVEVGADDTQLERTLKRSSNRLYAFGAASMRAGMGLMRASAAIAAPLVGGVIVFATFEDRMARVKALTGATGDAFTALSDKAQQLGKTTVFSASQAAEAMGYFALAGYDVQRILESIGPTLDLAAAGQLEVAEAADITAKVMSGMELKASRLGHVVDVLAAAFTSANTDLPMLGEALRYVGPIAERAGWSIEATVAAIQLLSNAGIQGQQAGTALRGALLQLTAPSVEAAKTLAQLNVQVADAAGNVRPLASIIRDLNTAMEGMGSAEQLKVFGTIFSARQVTGMAKLLVQGADKLEEYTAALREAGGTAAKIAAVQLDTLRGASKLLVSALEGLGIAVGASLAPVLRAVLAPVAAATAAMAEFAGKYPGLTVAIGVLTVTLAALGVGLVAVGVVAKVAAIGVTGYGIAVGIASTVTTLWTARVGMLTTALLTLAAHPLIAVAAGIALVATAIAIATRRMGEMRTETELLASVQDRQGQKDLERIGRLQELADNTRKTNTELAEARRLVDALDQRYANLGLTLVEASGGIHGIATALERVNEAMRATELASIDKEIGAIQERLAHTVRKMAQQGEGGIAGYGRMVGGLGWGEVARIEAARDDLFRELDVLTKRRAALRSVAGGVPGAPGAVGGATGGPEGDEAAGQRRATLAAEWARKVHQLRLQQGDDEHQQSLALLEERYQHEYNKAIEQGTLKGTLQDIEKAWLLESSLLEREHAQRVQGEHRRLEHDLEVAKLQNIENTHDREVALIAARYDYEIGEAERLGDARRVALLEQTEAAELAGAAAREATHQWELAREIQRADQTQLEQVEDLRLRAQLKGVELERALFGLRRIRALEEATAAGENLALVEEEFALRQKLLDVQGAGIGERLKIAGTFSAQEARGMGPSSLEERRTRDTGIMAIRMGRMVELLTTIESQNRLVGRYR